MQCPRFIPANRTAPPEGALSHMSLSRLESRHGW